MVIFEYTESEVLEQMLERQILNTVKRNLDGPTNQDTSLTTMPQQTLCGAFLPLCQAQMHSGFESGPVERHPPTTNSSRGLMAVLSQVGSSDLVLGGTIRITSPRIQFEFN